MAATAGADEKPALVRSLTTTSVPEQVSKEIRRAILSGNLEPGQTFSLREISGQLGVSFIPVREALRELEAQGLVVIRPGKSAMVAPLSHADLHGIYRLRRQIEPEIAGRASKLLTNADIARAEAYLAVFADETLDIDDIYEAHHAFHYQLLRPAATEWDLRILDGLWLAAERYVRLAFAGRDADPDEPHRRWHTHHELLTATLTRNVRTVATATRKHLDDNEQIALRALDPIAP
ncbi:GntR family transcriptional regulator [Aldersonia sp. NBC_00410]|uniref:GntR family transcriptional regulator n=1 Tax=Aldersonia sp. NBC_00410 TaxID=2975954 RepID=UPI0022565BAA|nr:GntR family transcriptional regulator [Aldersonia sp. NBC_00410]MCX5042373.1 GntR family transcriptional regulator [Aldersonia sp. NBC_00410]